MYLLYIIAVNLLLNMIKLYPNFLIRGKNIPYELL